MILTKEEFLNYGFKVSADSSAELAIKECELFHVKSALTDEVYLRCQEESEEMEIIREGGNLNGKVYAGLKFAIAHLSFAYLLRPSSLKTRYLPFSLLSLSATLLLPSSPQRSSS